MNNYWQSDNPKIIEIKSLENEKVDLAFSLSF